MIRDALPFPLETFRIQIEMCKTSYQIIPFHFRKLIKKKKAQLFITIKNLYNNNLIKLLIFTRKISLFRQFKICIETILNIRAIGSKSKNCNRRIKN